MKKISFHCKNNGPGLFFTGCRYMFNRFIFCVLITLFACSHAVASDKKVFIINSYDQSFEWVASYMSAFAEELGDAATIESFDMNTKRLPVEAYPERARLALEQLDSIMPDVVVTGDDNALKLLGKRILARGYPLVYLGINNNPRSYLGDASLATGVLERPLLKRSIVYLQDIYDEKFDRCLVLFDVSTTSEVFSTFVFKGRESISFGGITVDLIRTNDWSRWQEAVRDADKQGYDAIILGLHHRILGEDGKVLPSEEVLRWTSANTKVPPFSFWANNVGEGRAIGGLVLSPEPQGRLAAGLTKAILAGKSASDLSPVMAEQGVFLFSESELARWNVDLPDNIGKEAKFLP